MVPAARRILSTCRLISSEEELSRNRAHDILSLIRNGPQLSALECLPVNEGRSLMFPHCQHEALSLSPPP